ncbi:MAG: hypothetical protein AAFV53_18455 [Myxococcota bacterium]
MMGLSGPLVWVLAAASTASAETPEIITLSPERRARAVSLDIRGVVPTPEEMEQISRDGGLSDAMLEDWLQSDAFTEQAVRHHRALLWNELSLNNLLGNRQLRRQNNIWYNGRAAEYSRGLRNLSCGNFEATVDADGVPTEWQVDENGYIREGWVEVNPYWAPETTVRACAFDAMTTVETSTGDNCATDSRAHRNTECGCGPDLQWCITNNTRRAFVDALEREMEHRVRDVIGRDAPYSELLIGTTGMVNGPLVHLYTHLAPFESDIAAPTDLSSLPDLDFSDAETWVNIELYEHHSGILTAPGWLLRHQTNRGRANRFYEGFLCREFIPLPTGIGGMEEGTPTPDLTLRTGCESCHARLEPWAAYWGRWQEASSSWLSPSRYPDYLEECETCAIQGGNCSMSLCRNYYVSSLTHPDEEPYAGWMDIYSFLGPDAVGNPDIGPAGWVSAVVDDGQLAQCAAQNASGWLLGEDVTPDDDQLGAWAALFASSDESYRSLFRSIITSEIYGRVK